MQINYMLDGGAYVPIKAHDTDAGFDIKTPMDVTIPPNGSVEVNTGVHFEIPKGYTGFIKSKSGLNVKRNLTAEGVIDSGYTGAIVVKMYNHGEFEQKLYAGDKLTQIVFLPIPEVELVKVGSFANTERGDKGFGSSGR